MCQCLVAISNKIIILKQMLNPFVETLVLIGGFFTYWLVTECELFANRKSKSSIFNSFICGVADIWNPIYVGRGRENVKWIAIKMVINKWMAIKKQWIKNEWIDHEWIKMVFGKDNTNCCLTCLYYNYWSL